MLWRAYKKALAEYFIFIIIAVILASVTMIFWLGVPFYLFGNYTNFFKASPFVQQLLLNIFISFFLMLYIAPFHWQVAKNTAHVKRTFFTVQTAAIVLGIIIIYVVILYNENSAKADFQTVVYEFPNTFRGCAVIFYDVEGAPPLEIVNERLTFSFLPNKEVLLTSSPQTFGWANEEHSGWYQTEIYVGDKQLPADSIHATTGSFGHEQFEFNYSGIWAEGTPPCYAEFDDVFALYEKHVQQVD